MNCNTERGRDCTVSAMIDGGPDNLLGTFLIVSYSVAYTTLTVVVDGTGQRASMQVDDNPFVSTDICTGGACSYEQGKSSQLLQEMLTGSQHHRAGLDAGRQHGRAAQAVAERLRRPVSESRPGPAGPLSAAYPNRSG